MLKAMAKLGSFRQNGKVPNLSWEAEILGTGPIGGLDRILAQSLKFFRKPAAVVVLR